MPSPEILLARRLTKRLELSPPVAIETIVRKYADVVFAAIPVPGVDGVCLDLKVPGKAPRVIVNDNNPATRKRFTLAHELGHILIPWHLGSIIDDIDVPPSSPTFYGDLEREANAFAAEVLMPEPWIRGIVSKIDNLARVHGAIAKTCNVSPYAAARRLSGFLPAGSAYASVKGKQIQFAGRSEGTIAVQLLEGTSLSSDAYDYADHHYTFKYGDAELHWWRLPSSMTLNVEDGRSWREVLNSIASEICDSMEAAIAMKQSVNGVAAFANSVAKRTESYTQESVAAACIQRFKDREEFAAFVKHEDFETYVSKRAAAFFED